MLVMITRMPHIDVSSEDRRVGTGRDFRTSPQSSTNGPANQIQFTRYFNGMYPSRITRWRSYEERKYNTAFAFRYFRTVVYVKQNLDNSFVNELSAVYIAIKTTHKLSIENL
jgi:hypothetical protein